MSADRVEQTFVQPDGIEVVAWSELSEDSRARLEGESDDAVVRRSGSRHPGLVLDRDAVRFFEFFERPRSLVDAVLMMGATYGWDREPPLEDAAALLRALLGAGLVRRADGGDAAGGVAGGAGGEGSGEIDVTELRAGDVVAGRWQVVRALQSFRDSTVYLVHGATAPDGATARPEASEPAGPAEAAAWAAGRSFGVLKTLPHGESATRRFAEEARLQRLAALQGLAPRVLAVGEDRGALAVLVSAWCPGVSYERLIRLHGLPADPTAEEHDRWRRRSLEACGSAARALAALHGADLCHGDLHPGNLFLLGDGSTRFIDLAYASEAEPAPLLRVGVPFHLSPEQAAAPGEAPAEGDRVSGVDFEARSCSEQYSLATILYELVAGAPYLDFRMDREGVHRQIVADPPRDFEEVGCPAWPELEAVLGRALAKEPAERYRDVGALADAFAHLRAAPAEEGQREPSGSSGAARPTVADRIEARGREMLRACDPAAGASSLWRDGVEPPTASVHLGAAGLALGNLALAFGPGAGKALLLADLWSGRAARELEAFDRESPSRADASGSDAGGSDAGGVQSPLFHEPAVDVGPAATGPNALFHGPLGVAVTRWLVLESKGRAGGADRELARVARWAEVAPAGFDFAMGEAGRHAALRLVLHLRRAAERPMDDAAGGALARLAAVADISRDALLAFLREQPTLRRSRALDGHLGFAHGWAGILWSLLLERPASGPRSLVAERLRQLAALAEPEGAGLRWPWLLPAGSQGASRRSMSGWCNGTAGHLLLWQGAAEALPDEVGVFAQLAEGAAWDTWQETDEHGSLCCGLAGRALALRLYADARDEEPWRDRARDLALRSSRSPYFDGEYPQSVMRGWMGGVVALSVAGRSPR